MNETVLPISPDCACGLEANYLLRAKGQVTPWCANHLMLNIISLSDGEPYTIYAPTSVVHMLSKRAVSDGEWTQIIVFPEEITSEETEASA